MNTWKSVAAVPAVLAALAFAGPLSCIREAKHDHQAHDHAGHPATSDASAATPAAKTYADAIQQLRAHMTSLDAILKSGEYDAVHKDSVAIGKIGDSLGALASAPGSPVPQDKVKDVTTAGAEIKAASRTFHKAAHDDDLATVKGEYARMGRLIDSLAQLQAGGTTAGHGGLSPAATASVYTCPHHPEVVSDKPGTCPKCEMKLVAKK